MWQRDEQVIPGSICWAQPMMLSFTLYVLLLPWLTAIWISAPRPHVRIFMLHTQHRHTQKGFLCLCVLFLFHCCCLIHNWFCSKHGDINRDKNKDIYVCIYIVLSSAFQNCYIWLSQKHNCMTDIWLFLSPKSLYLSQKKFYYKIIVRFGGKSSLSEVSWWGGSCMLQLIIS